MNPNLTQNFCLVLLEDIDCSDPIPEDMAKCSFRSWLQLWKSLVHICGYLWLKLIEGLKLRCLIPARERKGSTEDLLELHRLSLVLNHRIKDCPELGLTRIIKVQLPKDSPRVTLCASALSKCFLKSARLSAVTTSPGTLSLGSIGKMSSSNHGELSLWMEQALLDCPAWSWSIYVLGYPLNGFLPFFCSWD